MLARTLSFSPMSADLTRMTREIDRMFDSIASSPRLARAISGNRAAPAVNLWQDANNLYAEAELPGVRAEDIEVTAHGDTLTIKGSRAAPGNEQTKNTIRAERFHGEFERVLTLPAEIDADGITASLSNGVLTVTLPKARAAQPRTITVSAG